MKKITLLILLSCFLTGCHTTHNHYHGPSPMYQTTRQVDDLNRLLRSIENLDRTINRSFK